PGPAAILSQSLPLHDALPISTPTVPHAVSGLLITGVAAIVNVCAVDVAPGHVGLVAVIDAVPAVAMRDAGTVAVSCVEETNVVSGRKRSRLNFSHEKKSYAVF